TETIPGPPAPARQEPYNATAATVFPAPGTYNRQVLRRADGFCRARGAPRATAKRPRLPRMSRKPAKSTRSAKPARSSKPRWLVFTLAVLAIPVTAIVSVMLVTGLALLLANDRLPPLDALIDYRPRVPLRVYTADGVLIGEFGEERRTFVRIEDVPKSMQNAVLAAEDARFFEHAGVDLVGVGRAALANL